MAALVEMRGIEPRSEEKTIKTFTPIARSNISPVIAGAGTALTGYPKRIWPRCLGRTTKRAPLFRHPSTIREARLQRMGCL